MQDFRFILQPYKGPATRTECPNCHRPRCFSRYIDTEGKIELPAFVGRCDHEHSCGYHYTPKQYFHDYPETKEMFKSKTFLPCHPQPPAMAKPKLEPYFFPFDIVCKTMSHYDENNFARFLFKRFNREKVIEIFREYCVGTAKYGRTVFWQLDGRNMVHDAKIMFYNPETGHRSKDPEHHVTWLHSLMHIDKERIHQCFFGEHVICQHLPSDKIAIVESEKTAIIGALEVPELVWIATGGKDGMFNQGNYSIFKSRDVIFFPDLGELDNWKSKAAKLQAAGAHTSVFTYLEQWAGEQERKEGLDISDYLLQDTKQDILNRMMAQSPAIKTLVDGLGLIIVEDDQ